MNLVRTDIKAQLAQYLEMMENDMFLKLARDLTMFQMK